MKKRQQELMQSLRQKLRIAVNEWNVDARAKMVVIFGGEDEHQEEHGDFMNKVFPRMGYEFAEIQFCGKKYSARLQTAISKNSEPNHCRLILDIPNSPELPTGDVRLLYNTLEGLEESVQLVLDPIEDEFAPKIWVVEVKTSIALDQLTAPILCDALSRLSKSAESVSDRLIRGDGHDHWNTFPHDDDDGDEPVEV